MNDDYKDEYLLRLKKSELYNALKENCSDKDANVIPLVEDCTSYAFQRTKTIVRHMGEFTLHDGDHLFRVLNLMERLIPKETIDELTSPELLLLIISAFFHDIGMAPDEKEVLAWKKVWDIESIIDENEQNTFNDFKRFYNSRPEDEKRLKDLISKGNISQADTIKSYLITEYIRQTHADRARDIIEQDWSEKIKFRDTDLTVELAQICYSHNEDSLSLLDLDKNLLCGSGVYACLPLVGVILRLADILDFDGKRTPSVLFSHLYVRNPISINEWNKHRAIEAWDISPDLIQFSAKCAHPVIESSIHEFCSMIDHELSLANNIISTLNEFHTAKDRNLQIKLPLKVNREKIRTKTDIKNRPVYIYKDTKFNLSKTQVIELLMGTKLYGNPEVALRELLQNSIDACLLRKAQEDKWGNLYQPKVLVKYYTENEEDVLEVIDNGTGMDEYIIDNYYSKIGSSFYKSKDFYSLKAETNADFSPTSRFGIGILSSFMISDVLIVDTKRVYGPHKSSDPLNITVEGQESIFWIKSGTRETPGTSTRLILRKSHNPWDRMTENEFIENVENVIPNPPFEISIETQSHKKKRDENSFKEITSYSLKDYTWQENENIKFIDIPIDRKDIGLVGSATVAILESKNRPVERVELNSRDIEIEGESYTLERELRIDVNSIKESSKTITISDDGDIRTDDSSSKLASSNSKISLHGIEIPSSLFPERWRMKNNQVKINWPFPLIIVIDVCGNRDLDLNSPRTEIIISEKWTDFEEQLARIVCQHIKDSVEIEYWNNLFEIFNSSNSSENFKRALNELK